MRFQWLVSFLVSFAVLAVAQPTPYFIGATLLMVGQEASYNPYDSTGVEPLTCDWHWDDGTSTLGLDCVCYYETHDNWHSWSSPGTYTVTLNVTDACGLSSQYSREVEVPAGTCEEVFPDPPDGNFWCDKDALSVGAVITCRFLSSSGVMKRCRVDFGDGAVSPWTNTKDRGCYPTDYCKATFHDHIYDTPGDYTITGTIQDYCGRETNFTKTVSVGDCLSDPSVAIGSINRIPGGCLTKRMDLVAGLNYSFYVEAEDGTPPYQLSVDWDDGSPPTETTVPLKANRYYTNVYHVYSSPGTFNTEATVTDSCGKTGSQIITVEVKNCEDFSPSIEMIVFPLDDWLVGNQINFDLTSSGAGGDVWMSVDFGDKKSSFLECDYHNTFTHNYAIPGEFDVIATALQNCDGASVTATETITITGCPVEEEGIVEIIADAGGPYGVGAAGGMVDFDGNNSYVNVTDKEGNSDFYYGNDYLNFSWDFDVTVDAAGPCPGCGDGVPDNDVEAPLDAEAPSRNYVAGEVPTQAKLVVTSYLCEEKEGIDYADVGGGGPGGHAGIIFPAEGGVYAPPVDTLNFTAWSYRTGATTVFCEYSVDGGAWTPTNAAGYPNGTQVNDASISSISTEGAHTISIQCNDDTSSVMFASDSHDFSISPPDCSDLPDGTSCDGGTGACCGDVCCFPPKLCCSSVCRDAACSGPGDCPPDGDPCHENFRCELPGTCNAHCDFDTKACGVGGDGCCPLGCTNPPDGDCPPSPPQVELHYFPPHPTPKETWVILTAELTAPPDGVVNYRFKCKQSDDWSELSTLNTFPCSPYPTEGAYIALVEATDNTGSTVNQTSIVVSDIGATLKVLPAKPVTTLDTRLLGGLSTGVPPIDYTYNCDWQNSDDWDPYPAGTGTWHNCGKMPEGSYFAIVNITDDTGRKEYAIAFYEVVKGGNIIVEDLVVDDPVISRVPSDFVVVVRNRDDFYSGDYRVEAWIKDATGLLTPVLDQSEHPLPGMGLRYNTIPDWIVDEPGDYEFIAKIFVEGVADPIDTVGIPFNVKESRRIIFAPEYPPLALLLVLLVVPFAAFWLGRKPGFKA